MEARCDTVKSILPVVYKVSDKHVPINQRKHLTKEASYKGRGTSFSYQELWRLAWPLKMVEIVWTKCVESHSVRREVIRTKTIHCVALCSSKTNKGRQTS